MQYRRVLRGPPASTFATCRDRFFSLLEQSSMLEDVEWRGSESIPGSRLVQVYQAMVSARSLLGHWALLLWPAGIVLQVRVIWELRFYCGTVTCRLEPGPFEIVASGILQFHSLPDDHTELILHDWHCTDLRLRAGQSRLSGKKHGAASQIQAALLAILLRQAFIRSIPEKALTILSSIIETRG